MTTRYHRAAKDGAVHILKKATKKDLNRRDDDGMTATLYTASNGHLKALETCCKRDGNPDECDYSGNSAVHLAAMNGNLACLKFLVSYGANVWVLDNDFHSPRDVAVIRNQQSAVQFLDAAMNEETRKNPKKVKDKQEKEKKKAEKRKQNYERMLEDQYSAERRSSLMVGGTVSGRRFSAATSSGGRTSASSGGTVSSIGSTLSRAFNKSSKKNTTLRSNMAPPIIEEVAAEDQHPATERAAVVDPKQPVSNFILGKTREMRDLEAPSNEQDAEEADFQSKFDRFAQPGQYHPFGTALRSNITSARSMFGAIQETDDVNDDDVDRSDAIVPTSNRPTLEGVFEERYDERRMWSNDEEDSEELSPLEEFLKQINLTEYTDLFLEQRLDIDLLMECSDEDLLNMGMPLGHRKIVLRSIEKRRRENDENPETTLF